MRAEASDEIVVHRPPERVADYVLDPATLGQWRTEATATRRVGEGVPEVGARYRVRGPARRVELMRTDEVVALDPGERLVLRTVEGGDPFELEITVQPDGPASTLVRADVRADLDGPRGLLAPLRTRRARRALGEDLARLKTILELPDR